MRCLGHAHHGCVCYWPSKLLYTHVPDAQLLAMKGLLQCLVKQVPHALHVNEALHLVSMRPMLLPTAEHYMFATLSCGAPLLP